MAPLPGLFSFALSKEEDEDLTLRLPPRPAGPPVLLVVCCWVVIVVVVVVVVTIEVAVDPTEGAAAAAVAAVALMGFSAERLLESKLERDTLRPREPWSDGS